MNKEIYEELKMKVIAFETVDIITDSDSLPDRPAEDY